MAGPQRKRRGGRETLPAGLAVVLLVGALSGCKLDLNLPAAPKRHAAYVDVERCLALHPGAARLAVLDRELARLSRPPVSPRHPHYSAPEPIFLTAPTAPAAPAAPAATVDAARVEKEVREDYEVRKLAQPDRAEEAYQRELDRLRRRYIDVRDEPLREEDSADLQKAAALAKERAALQDRIRRLEERPEDRYFYTAPEREARRKQRQELQDRLAKLLGPVVETIDDTAVAEKRRKLEREVRALQEPPPPDHKLTKAEKKQWDKERRARARARAKKQAELDALLANGGSAEDTAFEIHQKPLALLQEALKPAERRPGLIPRAQIQRAQTERETLRKKLAAQMQVSERQDVAQFSRVELPKPAAEPAGAALEEPGQAAARDHTVDLVQSRGLEAGMRARTPQLRDDRRAEAVEAVRGEREALRAQLIADLRAAAVAAGRARGLDVVFERGEAPDRTAELQAGLREALTQAPPPRLAAGGRR